MTMKIKYKYLNNGKTKLLFTIWLTQKASCSVKNVFPNYSTLFWKEIWSRTDSPTLYTLTPLISMNLSWFLLYSIEDMSDVFMKNMCYCINPNENGLQNGFIILNIQCIIP